ncbi:MAG TPA: 5'-nucleotidase, lipoprotein e(P4) family [Chitinophagaceae bacterium]|nr:5'-nucleotidase, lipoprotein e(P4) family [Chitinophagaceae bacterium]
MRYFLILVCPSMLLIACSGSKRSSSSPTPSYNIVTDGKLWSSLFEQKAAEYQALCLQAYNIARLRLDDALQQPSSKPKAIITDIDETFLDNSPFSVHQALQGKDYESAGWAEWTAKAMADTLTGALSFFNYAASRNVEIFYISNRRETEREGTLQNLRHFHFPLADEQHLILRKDVSSKEPRRQQVAATHEIVLLLGDNLADFSAFFDGPKTTSERAANVQRLALEFGKRFIVLPNANYGGWEDAVYGNNFSLSPQQKDSAIKSILKTY